MVLLNTRPLAPLNGASSHFLYLWHDVNTPSYGHHGGKLLPEFAENPIGSAVSQLDGQRSLGFHEAKTGRPRGDFDPLIPMGIFQFLSKQLCGHFQGPDLAFSGTGPRSFSNGCGHENGGTTNHQL